MPYVTFFIANKGTRSMGLNQGCQQAAPGPDAAPGLNVCGPPRQNKLQLFFINLLTSLYIYTLYILLDEICIVFVHIETS